MTTTLLRRCFGQTQTRVASPTTQPSASSMRHHHVLSQLLLIVVVAAAAAAAARVPAGGSSTRLRAAPPPAGAPEWPRPPHTQHAQLARWLVHTADWGSLASTSDDGSVSGGVVSIADGDVDNPTGRIFTYLTPMDEAGHNVAARPDCALVVAEAQLRPAHCGGTDPEDPTCAKIEVRGRMLPVPATGPDARAAAEALFTRHPAMKTWPKDHGFLAYELHVDEVHMLDWYGGMHVIPGADYYAASLAPPPSSSSS